MAVVIEMDPVPLKADRDGALRVGGTRVLLSTVVNAFHTGASPEEIVLAYDALDMEDVYSVIGYYIRHRSELDAYFAERQRRIEANAARSKARLPWSEVRARLLARQDPSDSSLSS